MAKERRILAVDDDSLNLAVLEELLGDEFVLSLADSGEKALDLAQEIRPDLMLLDIMMTGIDGYETCRRMREMPNLKFCKIILVSAKAMLAERMKGYQVGADDYVTKPFDPCELLAKVKVFLRLKNMEELDQLKTDFLTLLNHETRNPLTYILNPADLLATEPTMPDSERQRLGRVVVGGAERLRDLFEQATVLFQLKSDRVTPVARSLDLRAVAEDALLRRADSARHHGVTLTLQSPSSLEMSGHTEALRGLIANMVNQVLAGRSEGDEIVVRLATDGESVEIALSDKEERYQLMTDLGSSGDPFHVSDLRHHGGPIELQLPLIRELARWCQGDFSIEPANPGEVTLSARLPVHVDSFETSMIRA